MNPLFGVINADTVKLPAFWTFKNVVPPGALLFNSMVEVACLNKPTFGDVPTIILDADGTVMFELNVFIPAIVFAPANKAALVLIAYCTQAVVGMFVVESVAKAIVEVVVNVVP